MKSGDQSPALFWFRDDLRLRDNPGLAAAAETGRPLICLFMLDDSGDGTRPLGGASRWWLHHSLRSLADSLGDMGQRLIVQPGQAREIVPAMVRRTGAREVFWNRRYGEAAALDAAIASRLESDGCSVSAFSANLLYEPDAIRTGSGEPFKVYSAFWRAAQRSGRPRTPLPAPKSLPAPPEGIEGESLEFLDLLPTGPDWSGGLQETWTPGEAGAADRLGEFVEDALAAYAERRDYPGEPATSMLSPHLRFGEIGPVQILDALDRRRVGAGKFVAELGWREFAHHALEQAPGIARANLRPEFDAFPWIEPDLAVLRAWQKGRTGYPIVDAGMRQLWHTGWMHNRVRMVVASFLTKHLLIDWRHGEAWFWDTLVDADPANNPFGWQWVAGSGFDAQPYFRVFNPVLQGEKFDPKGTYVRKFVPEIAVLPDRFIHRPWDASPMELRSAGITLGKDYQEPIVDHTEARRRAVAAYDAMRA